MHLPDRLVPWLAGALLAVMAVLAGGAALRESVTYDEVAHIGAGVSYWQRLDLRLNEEHPPLAKIIAALPLVITSISADYSHNAWTTSEHLFPAYTGQLYFGELVLKHWNKPATTLALARLPMLVLTLLLGWVVYLSARQIGGPQGALLSTTVYATTPLFLGFGPLAITDVPVAFFVALTLLTLASLWRTPTRTAGALFGLSLAGALLVKFNGLILLPALALFAITSWPGFRAPQFRAMALGLVIAFSTVYAVYLFFSWSQPAPVARWMMPLWLYLRGLFLVSLASSRSTYLAGHSYSTGVWFYFPALLILKSSIGFLLLLFAAFFKMRMIPTDAGVNWRLLWITCAVFSAAWLVSKLDIGFRHFSVPLALLIVMLAVLPRVAGRISGPFIVACAAQCLFAALAAYPLYIPYSNILGDFWPHYEVFNDSNLDWDQSMPEVARFVKAHGIASIGLDHEGYTDAATSVPNSYIRNCEYPLPSDGGRWVVVSATVITQVRNCRWLLGTRYEILGGGSLYAVRLPQTIPAVQHTSGFFRTSDGGDSRQLFVDFARDPTIVQRSAIEANQILSEWSNASPLPGRLKLWLGAVPVNR